MSRPAPPPTSAIDWATLGFTERRVAGQVVCTWRDGAWGAPTWSSEPELKIHAAASCLNYGQQCFEGIKVRQTWGRRNEGEWAAPRQRVAGETALGHRGPACEALRSGGIIGTGGALQLAGHARRASHAS
jgi:hypothetical protein